MNSHNIMKTIWVLCINQNNSVTTLISPRKTTIILLRFLYNTIVKFILLYSRLINEERITRK